MDMLRTLLSRIAALNTGVNSWNVLTLPADPAARKAAIGGLPLPWRVLVDQASEFTVGFRYGSTAHMDFSIRLMSNPSQETQDLERAVTLEKINRLTNAQTHVENLSSSSDRITGSLAMPRKQFEACFRNLVQGTPALLEASR